MNKKKKTALAIIVVTLFIFIGVPIIMEPSDKHKIEVALKFGRLAPLPESAMKILVETRGNMMSGTFYLCFQGPSSDIEKWIKSSDGLKGVEVRHYTEKNMLLPYPNSADDSDPDQDYFHRNKKIPWYNPTIRKKGRRFDIPQDKEANYGMVIINDTNGVVYIKTSHS